MGLLDISLEERKENLRRAMVKNQALRENLKTMKTQWPDEDGWMEIARQYNFRLPQMQYLPDASNIRTWCRRLKITEKEFRTWGGYSSLDEFQIRNPRWPLRALVGVLLEYYDERETARKALGAKLSGTNSG